MKIWPLANGPAGWKLKDLFTQYALKIYSPDLKTVVSTKLTTWLNEQMMHRTDKTDNVLFSCPILFILYFVYFYYLFIYLLIWLFTYLFIYIGL